MPIELEPEQREFLIEAAEYRDLLNSPGWKRIWKVGEAHVREALTAMKNSRSADPQVLLAMQIVWREREKFMDALHTEICLTIDRSKEVVEQVGIAMGATQDEIEQLVEQEDFYGRP